MKYYTNSNPSSTTFTLNKILGGSELFVEVYI